MTQTNSMALLRLDYDVTCGLQVIEGLQSLYRYGAINHNTEYYFGLALKEITLSKLHKINLKRAKFLQNKTGPTVRLKQLKLFFLLFSSDYL